MGKMAIDRSQSTLVDAFLRDEMARGNRALRSVAPVIGHLLDVDGPSLFDDGIVARIRGMVSNIAEQLLEARALGPSDGASGAGPMRKLIDQLATDQWLIDHLYTVALEGQLTQRLQQSAAIDPVLSPLMQELVASDKPEIAELAMSVLAAQSRFFQGQQRMELSIGELPSELFVHVLDLFEATDLGLEKGQSGGILTKLASEFDEGAGRTALLTRLTSTMHSGAIAALDLSHAGLALFANAAALLTGQSRERVVFACHEGQVVRLALTLKAAGLKLGAIEGQLALLGGTKALPFGFDALSQTAAQDALREMSEV